VHKSFPSSFDRQGRSEGKDTLALISYGVDISIAGGGADVLPERNRGVFSFLIFSFFIMYWLLRSKKPHGALAIAKTKLKIENQQTKARSVTHHLQRWSVPLPGPYMGTNSIKYIKGNLPPTSGKKYDYGSK